MKFSDIKILNEEQNFKNGDKVYLTKDYEDKPGERFTVSDVNIESKKCRISDKDGRGWNVRFYQLTKKKP